MNSSSKPVAVLGAGVCGLYAAINLAEKGIPVIVVEREKTPGGLAAGHRRGENFYDLGVHMLHADDAEVFAKTSSIMGDERTEVELDAKIRWANRFFHYPLQFRDMVRGIPPITLIRCVSGLFTAQLRHRVSPVEPVDAEQALIQLYGDPLYRYFFEQFTNRYWGLHPRELSATFIKTKMPRLSAVDVLKNLLEKLGFKPQGQAVSSALRRETLHYSRNGAEGLPRRLMQRCIELGGVVYLNSTLEKIDIDKNGAVAGIRIKQVESGEIKHIALSDCLSTIPLPALLNAISADLPPALREAQEQLRYKAIAVYGLLINKPKALDALYIYYRERIFHRVGEPKNAGMVVTPKDHTVLIVEMTCEFDDDRWNGGAETWKTLLADLQAEGICEAQHIVESHIIHSAEAYPIFARGFEPHLDAARHYIQSIPGLISTGRQGAFCYPNMHGAMRMGADAANELLASAESRS